MGYMQYLYDLMELSYFLFAIYWLNFAQRFSMIIIDIWIVL